MIAKKKKVNGRINVSIGIAKRRKKKKKEKNEGIDNDDNDDLNVSNERNFLVSIWDKY